MQITEFVRDNENFSIGAAAGEGLHYRFVVANATDRIEYLEELVDGEWRIVAGPPPLYLATLTAVRMADERWTHRQRQLSQILAVADQHVEGVELDLGIVLAGM